MQKKSEKSKKLKELLEEIITIIIRKQFEILAEIIEKKYVNEFIIAKKLDITVNQTRNILYKLSDKGVVSSMRKKDKKKGWFTFFWKIEILKSLEFLKSTLEKRIEQIEHQIKSRETKVFYMCERCNKEFTEESALMRNFTCEECGSLLVLKDNSKILKEFRKSLERERKEIIFVDDEIKIERGKIEKIRAKETNKKRAEMTRQRNLKKIKNKKKNKQKFKKKVHKKIKRRK